MFDLPDISVPISIFLIIWGEYMLNYVLYTIFNIYHLIRYGVYGFGLYLIVTIFAGGTVILVAGSAFLLMEYDWSVPLSLQNTIELYNEDLFPSL